MRDGEAFTGGSGCITVVVVAEDEPFGVTIDEHAVELVSAIRIVNKPDFLALANASWTDSARRTVLVSDVVTEFKNLSFA